MLRSASRRASCGRGFAPGEFRARVARAREAMAAAEVDALWCSSEADVRYFTGVDSEFWYSPTRPVFVVVPREGPVVAVAPEIWAPAFGAAAVDELRTWPAPREADDGVSLLVEALAGVPRTFGAIALPMGLESAPRAPVATVDGGAGKEREIPNFKGSSLGRFPLVSADFWTSDHLSERSRSMDAFSGTRARGTLMLERT
jgi:Xaa-Pro aminopeptidase